MKIPRRMSIILAASAVLFAAQARADFHDHLGLQLYSLRATTLAKGLSASLDQAKAWGFKEVEGGGSTGDMTAEQIRAALDAHGLTEPCLHAQYDRLTKDIAGVIHDAKTVGAQFVICPWVPHTGAFDEAVMKKTAEDFNHWGEACRAAGLTFGYHPHGYEFTPGSRAGETLFDDLVRATKPENVSFELDVFWAVHGGADPIKLLTKYPHRWVALHIKDIRKGAPTGLTTGHAPDTDNVTVGEGQIDWKSVVSTAQKLGVKYYFIEDETPTPLECVPASVAFLKTLKL